jgi:hypothetical protein
LLYPPFSIRLQETSISHTHLEDQIEIVVVCKDFGHRLEGVGLRTFVFGFGMAAEVHERVDAYPLKESLYIARFDGAVH